MAKLELVATGFIVGILFTVLIVTYSPKTAAAEGSLNKAGPKSPDQSQVYVITSQKERSTDEYAAEPRSYIVLGNRANGDCWVIDIFWFNKPGRQRAWISPALCN